TAEIGITLGDRAYRGQGLGREAVSHGLDILFRHFNIHRVTAHILETNTRSVALFEQVGFQHDGLMREDTWWEGRRVGTLILSKLRSEHMFNPTPTDTP
ncbi:MAG: GNAT family protein, partial [Myxococcota bacterium]